ncbi:hypothetical protein DICPUDRAFT_97412 [Dictyostelium purpureum]|uniref:Uncharacterized protein n=1 Tax=Dictyostelium purpureum TaxID=5786 RepID=F0ZGI1_DICPU|nr:uncharacterized protein DICPUDRAFT_97412 [Dictyostelium purpureum]EGC36960.1 hypothetical protein DICPUDRAFT_97412 [Dictyostelium purpureum]|eukprot:XP_003286528.1 hypothetical protein DICPUDRAFT_97412 [Dictyostelium purpureum]
MTTKPGNVKTLIEKYNEINENITKSISPRGLTPSLSNHSGSFILSNSNGNSFYISNNNSGNGSCSNHSSGYSVGSYIGNSDGTCLNSNSCLSPSMLSSLEGNRNNSNGNDYSSSGCCISDDTSSSSSSGSCSISNTLNKSSTWMKISLKINTDLISGSLCSSTNTSDDEQSFNNNSNNDNNSDGSNNSNKFSLSPRPIIKKQEPENQETTPPPNLDKRRYSRDLIPFTITNI